MEIAEWANMELLKLWEEFSHAKELTRRWPLLYNPLRKGGLLFVGLNPSWSEDWLEKYWKRLKSQGRFPTSGVRSGAELFEWDGPSRQKKDDIQKMDNVAVAKKGELYPYFVPMEKMASDVEMAEGWAHIDLFAVRERYQKLVRKELEIDKLVRRMREDANDSTLGRGFAGQQLVIATQLVGKLEPVAIVVANALASAILRARWKIVDPGNWREDETFIKNGHHEIELNGRTVPVFFSSMLSGQRALDKGSRERLAWQVWRALGRK